MMGNPDDVAELKALNARFIRNFITNDVAGHDAVLHPRFLYIGSAGQRVAREPYLVNWATGFDPDTLPYWDTRDERIDVFGDTALVRATNRFVEVNDGRQITGMVAYTDIYRREGGRWLCIQAQITPVAPEHWPGDETIVSFYLRGVKQAGRKQAG
jgi:ketosteroid isomerase-like protein